MRAPVAIDHLSAVPLPTPGSAWRRNLRRLAVLFTVSTYSLCAPFGYGVFALLCALLPPDPVRRARRVLPITTRAYRFLHAWLRLTRIAHFDHRGALTARPSRPCVYVANHPTALDVTSIMATIDGLFTVVKPRVFRRRMLRPLLVGAGHVEGPGGDPASTRRVIDESVHRLRAGLSLLIFPEGTRSPPGGMHPFGRTAFEIACQADVPLVSIAVRCRPLWLSKERGLFSPPDRQPRLQLEVLGIDEPAAVNRDSRTLRRRIEARYRRWLAQSPDGSLDP